MSSSSNLQIFVLGHKKECFDHSCTSNHLTNISLNDLYLPVPNTNDLAESRFFLVDSKFFEKCPEYIGVLTAQYNKKYPDLLHLKDLDILEKKCNPHLVWAASPTEFFNDGKWIEYSCAYHKTIGPYLEELSAFTKIPLVNNPTLWANNFICHKTVFMDFLEFFKKTFEHFHNKYGYNFQIHVDDPTRTAAYFYERVAMIYFSSRNDLQIIKIPEAPKFGFDNILWIASSAPNYEPLTKIWKESLNGIGVLDENIIHNIIEEPHDMKTTIKFQSDIWFYSINKKISNVLKALKSNINNKKYDYFISTDCDINFFKDRKKIWKILINYVDNHDFDMYFQPENGVELNSGFYIIKRSKINNAIRFLELVLKKMAEAKKKDMPYADQSIIRENIKKINACILPAASCVAGPFYNPENKDIYLFHHAICAYSLEMKLLQIEYIEKVHNLHK